MILKMRYTAKCFKMWRRQYLVAKAIRMRLRSYFRIWRLTPTFSNRYQTQLKRKTLKVLFKYAKNSKRNKDLKLKKR